MSDFDKKLLISADEARDQKKWLMAAQLYGRYLKKHPDDFAIHVQRGNCLKDGGQHDEALKTYQAAIQLNAEDADVRLQLGRLFKLVGLKKQAIKELTKAMELDPENKDIITELASLGGPHQTKALAGSHRAATIWLDIKDIVDYVGSNTSLSGIQRVVVNLITHMQAAVAAGYDVRPVMPEYGTCRFLAPNLEFVLSLFEIFDDGAITRSEIDRALGAIRSSCQEVTPEAGDIFIIAGAFWIYEHFGVIARLRQKGVLFSVFIHDLIQISFPEYVHHEATLVFQRQFVDVLGVTDFMLTNSHFVAQDVKNYMHERLNYTVPVKAVPLATELRESVSSGQIDDDVLTMQGEEYVLCVATIEIRKNHMYLVKIWERLRKKYGDKVPKLVFVGKWGWDIDALREHLDRTGCVGDWLHIFNGISDSALEFLYKNCLMTAYVSFAEGFGLPIGESLVYGKPCIASGVTSMPEVGGDLARYVDPYNLEEGYRLFEEVLMDREALAAWQKEVKTRFKARTWQDFCRDFYEAAIEFRKELAGKPPAINALLPAGEVIEGGTRALQAMADSGVKIITFRNACHSGWHYMEDWGVWSSRSRSRLVFDTDYKEAGLAVKIYLRLRCTPGSERAGLIITSGGRRTTVRLTEHDGFVVAEGETLENGRLDILLSTQGKYAEVPDGRTCYVGLTAVGYCLAEDVAGRIGMLEKVTFFR